jgi:hypothetical protein
MFSYVYNGFARYAGKFRPQRVRKIIFFKWRSVRHFGRKVKYTCRRIKKKAGKIIHYLLRNQDIDLIEYRKYKTQAPRVILKRTTESFFNINQLNKKMKIELGEPGDRQIIFGPWVSEIGFEVLYWAPFIRWIKSKYKLKSQNITIISRGGGRAWYSDITENYIDIFDYVALKDFKENQDYRYNVEKGLKQTELSSFEAKFLKRMTKDHKLNDYVLIHPSLMYKFFKPFWRGHVPVDFILNYTKFYHSKNPLIDRIRPSYLPKSEYISAKFYARESFLYDDQVVNKILENLKELLKKYPVVFLKTDLEVDDHTEPFYEKIYALNSPNAIFLDHLMDAKNNIAIQDEIVAHSKFFIGTYGGFAYLAPLYGKSAHTYFSVDGTFKKCHGDLLERYIEKKSVKDSNYHSSFFIQNINNDSIVDYIAR